MERVTDQRLLKECGAIPVRHAPVSCGAVRKPGRWKGYELDPLRHFLELRDKLVISPSAWSLRHGPNRRYGQRLLVAKRLHMGEGRGYVARLPEAVFTELLSGHEGNWCAIWRAVLAIPHGELSCARWFLALVAADLEMSTVGWAGQYAPREPVHQAWRVLRIKRGKGTAP